MPLKQIFAPHLNRTVKMGRRRPIARGPRLFFRNYLRLPAAPPPSADYSRAASSVLSNIYLNDQLGDCVIAGGYHVVGVETGNAGDLFGASDAQIVADYSAIGGYVPGDPSTDNGCDEATAANNGELYVMLTPDQLAKGQSKAPNGVDWSELISDFKSMGGNVPTLAARRAKPKLAAAKPKRARAIPAAWGGSGVPAGTIVAAAPQGTIVAHAAPMGTMVARAAPLGTMVAHAAPTGTMAARAAPWMPPPYPASYPVPPAPPAPPPPPLSEFGERVIKKVMRSPALGVVAVVGLVVLGVVGVVGLSGGSEDHG